MRNSFSVSTLLLLSALVSLAGAVQAQDPAPAANEQVIVPQVDVRPVKVPRIPSNDFELGAFTGTYNAQNFGASLVAGTRMGYHITEDLFVEAVYGQTKVSDDLFRQILPGGIFPNNKEILRYYNLSAGYNVFPGEIFLGRTHAKVSTAYLVAGLGTTKFNDASHQTVNVGAGMRVFSLDLLGTRKETQNVEFTAGLTLFF